MIKNLPNLKQVLAALLTIAALATGQTAWAWDGSGTSDSPWLIKTTNDLVALANNSASDTYFGKFFRLENDLDMSGVAIGTIGGNINGGSIKRFRGTFDGNGHAIRNLTINKPGDDHVGLFGIISASSTIRNLIIDGANITGNNYVGVIFGRTVDGGTIENCLVVNSSVTVTSSTGTYGGIISGCYLDNLTFSGNYYYNCSVTMGSNAPVTTNIATTVGDIDGAAIADATATVSLPDAWVTFGANQFVVGGYYYNGTIYYDSSIGYTVGPATWAALQTAFNNASTDAEHPTELTLAADITASASDSRLIVPYNKHVIIDLNGYAIDRHLSEPSSTGEVILVQGYRSTTDGPGHLTIRDSSNPSTGRITGGYAQYICGGVQVVGFFTLESGSICGNKTSGRAAGVYINNINTGGTFTMTGGSITNNTCYSNDNVASTIEMYPTSTTFNLSGGTISGNHGGQWVIEIRNSNLSDNFNLSGTYDISGNTKSDNTAACDIYCNSYSHITITAPISPVHPSTVRTSRTILTSGWATHMGSTDPEQCFTIDPATGKGIGIVNGEVHVGLLHSLTLADGLTASVTQAAQGKSVTLSGAAPSVSRYLVSYNDGEARTDHYAADTLGNATFLMPDADVMVSTETAVTYIDADGNEQTITDFTIVSSSYEFGDDFGTGTALLGVDDYTERWYAVVGTVSLDKRLSVEGNARLILCDAAALIVNADYDCGTAFVVTYNGLTIYGQAQGTGTLSVTNTGTAIGTHDNDITVNGGTVIATSTDIFAGIFISNGCTLTINRGTLSATGAYGISIDEGTLTLNGGTLNATGSGTNYAGIYATYDATVNILGGTLNATGTADAYGIYATGDGTTVTLGWTTPDDRITASSYSGTVKIADGKALKNGGTVYYGTLTAAQKSAIANVTLQPATQAEFIAAALPQTGTNEYTIYDSVGWNALCDALQDNDTWNRFSGDTVKLGADITVTRMAGSSYHDFMGTFDGQGHTLTVDYGSAESPITADNAAPFVNVESGCIIKNLHVAGDIYTSGKNAAGIAGTQYGAVTIRNCRVSTAIHSYTIGDGTHGGLVGNNGNGNGSALSIVGCVFDGKLLTEGETATIKCGGFVGWCHKEVTISNSLFAPTEVTIGTTSSATFARNGATITNCYYTTDFNDGEHFIDQGKQARSITADDYVTTLANAGTVSNNYTTSGLIFYNVGLKYGDVLYAVSNDEVSLTLGCTLPEGYVFNGYTVSPTEASLTGNDNDGYTLTMPNGNVTINATLTPIISYIDENGETQQCTEYTLLDGTETSLGTSGQETWYVADGTLNYGQTITISGNVHLILKDNAVMNVGTQSTINYGIGDGSSTASISIYGQSTGNSQGQLHVNASAVGIFAKDGNLTINGGEVVVTSSYGLGIFANGGNVIINGGEVEATGNNTNGEGIFATKNSSGNGGSISISNATVTANGSIGIQANSGITINSGTVTTNNCNYGIYASSCSLTINGGQVTANGSTYGIYAEGGNVTISGGQVTANGSTYDIYATNGNITISDGQVTANGSTYGIYAEGGNVNISGGEVEATGNNTNGNGGGILAIKRSGNGGSISISNATVTATGYIGISAQSGITINSGTVTANNCNYGIYADVSNLTISGGQVTANGNSCGIFGDNITITSGEVTANGPYGIYANNGNLIISGGQVTANGNSCGIFGDNITLGWTNASDFIYANSYYATGTLSIAEGKAFKDEAGNTYSSTIAQVNQAYAIDGKWLYPDCVVMKHITGYGNSTESDHWVFIASPVAGSIAPSEVHNLFPSAGETSNEYDLYRFNQSDDNGEEWQNWKATTTENHPDFTSLVNGQGYLYATKETRTLVFAGEYTAATGSVEVPLAYDPDANLAGWNLVGNPFAVGATSSQPFYRMNPEGTALSAQVEAGNTVEAMEGVFVQATGDDQTVTFTAQTRGDEKSAVAALNIKVGPSIGSGTSILDNAIVRFDGGQTLKKFCLRQGSTKLYIPQGGKDYAIACSNGQGEMPLNFRAKENGEYTITVNVDHVEMAYLHLIDNLTGADVDLLAANGGDARHGDADAMKCKFDGVNRVSTYTFTAKTTDYESRFKLVFSTNDADDTSTGSETEDLRPDDVRTQKIVVE